MLSIVVIHWRATAANICPNCNCFGVLVGWWAHKCYKYTRLLPVFWEYIDQLRSISVRSLSSVFQPRWRATMNKKYNVGQKRLSQSIIFLLPFSFVLYFFLFLCCVHCVFFTKSIYILYAFGTVCCWLPFHALLTYTQGF